MASQAVIATEAATVGLLIATGHLTIGLLLTLEMCSGIASSFAQPARQSLMPGLVPRTDLPAAVACNSLCFNVARFIGPAIAGPLIAFGGVAPAVFLNSAAYLIATFTMPHAAGGGRGAARPCAGAAASGPMRWPASAMPAAIRGSARCSASPPSPPS